MRILITGAGGAAAISVWKSLNDTHELYMADIDPCAAGLYLVPSKQRILLPEGSSKEYVPTLLSLCQKKHIELLIPTVDVELIPLAAEEKAFNQIGTKLPLSSVDVLKCCYDKYVLLKHCGNVISTPKTVLLSIETFSSVQEFPCFAKPRISAGSAGILILKNSEELSRLPMDNSYLIQELLPGEEYSVDVYIEHSGRPIAAVVRLRMKVDSGVAVTACTLHDAELEAMAIKVAEHVGIRYVANIQFKRDVNGKLKLLEINPRFPGTLPLTSAAGVDIPKLLIKDILEEPLPEKLIEFHDLMVVRYWTEHFFSPMEWKELCQK